MGLELGLLEDESDVFFSCSTDLGNWSTVDEMIRIMEPYKLTCPMFFGKVLLQNFPISIQDLSALREEIKAITEIKIESLWDRRIMEEFVAKVEHLVDRALKYNKIIVAI